MDTVLFDLDGTLLPLRNESFIRAYFDAFLKRFSYLNFRPQVLMKAVWSSTEAMMKNEGERLNREVFWEAFSSVLGADMRPYEGEFESFYKNEFNSVRSVVSPEPLAKECVKELKRRGYTVVLATNPIFPAVATIARIEWAGLDKGDFALITTYENSCFCKPNPRYFTDVLERIGKTPRDCIMIGNDAEEDGAAAKLGIPVYLLGECIIETEEHRADCFERLSFEDLKNLIHTLPILNRNGEIEYEV